MLRSRPSMFDDKRSKKLVLVAHCVLNQNSISDGTADFPSQFREIVELLAERRVGMVQLPCPELSCLGLDRKDKAGGRRELLSENSRIRDLMQEGHNIEKLSARGDEIAMEVAEYRRYGFEVLGLIGINRSPSCGVETTSRNAREEVGRGVFVAVIEERLRALGITLGMTGVRTGNVAESLDNVRELFRRAGRVPDGG
jgi:predicted secreted protein